MACTSHNQITSHPTKWDVFLSFRGIDTRDSFTDFLYHSLDRKGIRTFRDDPELRSGEVISSALLQAIHESKIYVVVLSKNYASSQYCLDELVEILGCYESMDRLVVPVFYYIEPSVAKYQTGSFDEAFRKHENRFDGDRLDKWRVTLKEVGKFSGYHVRENMSQADIINNVVDRVLHEVNPKTLDVAKYAVGLDSHVKDITRLFVNCTESVTSIGIYGMGGIGKTTLAKAVYNENHHRFQGSCFLENVREASETRKGITCLQQKLINDVLGCKNITVDNADQGIELIRARICSTKVLIVIDDLDNASSLNFLVGAFALGSTIVITTRDEGLLDSINVDAKYKVNELGDAESRQLFYQHAFGGYDRISKTFSELSEEILKHAGGIPLALTVCGSTLHNKPEEGWRWYIAKLRRDSIVDVEKILLLSFDALKLVDPMLQNIFLDIACFLSGNNEKEVIKIMETSYTFVPYYIDILKKRCLLTINCKRLMMHDLLKDMGRKIACNNSYNVFEKRTRLWVSEDIREELQENKVDVGREIECNNSPNVFEKVTRLCFAEDIEKLQEVFKENKGTEATQGISDTVIYLKDSLKQESVSTSILPESLFRYCKSLPFRFLQQKLVHHLVLPGMLNKGFEHLDLEKKDLSNCVDLTTTTDLTMLSLLETLNCASLGNWKRVPLSIGNLERLCYLSFQGMEDLKVLSDSICNLRALKSLTIAHCSHLEALPVNLGNIESLAELNLEWLIICKLPHSIGRLSKLIKLSLSFCPNLKTLPDSICNLRSLKILYISWCSRLKVLPIELRNLDSLVELKAKTLPSASKLLIIKHLI